MSSLQNIFLECRIKNHVYPGFIINDSIDYFVVVILDDLIDQCVGKLVLGVLDEHLVEIHVVYTVQADKGREDIRGEVLQDVQLITRQRPACAIPARFSENDVLLEQC